MRVSESGVRFLKDREGFRERAYKDTGGVWTVGYGTTDGVSEGMTVTKELADKLLRSHLRSIEVLLNHEVKQALSQHQFDALASFIYNVGFRAFTASTLLKKINLLQMGEVPGELKKWVYDNGKVIEGLKQRRLLEARLFRNGYVSEPDD